MSPDHAVALRLIGEMRARLDALEAVVRGVEPPRPPAPTRLWCFLPGGFVRWAGKPVRVRGGLRALLAALLDAGCAPGRPAAYDVLEELIELNERRLPKSLSELNAALSLAGWPFDYHAAAGHVFAD